MPLPLFNLSTTTPGNTSKHATLIPRPKLAEETSPIWGMVPKPPPPDRGLTEEQKALTLAEMFAEIEADISRKIAKNKTEKAETTENAGKEEKTDKASSYLSNAHEAALAVNSA